MATQRVRTAGKWAMLLAASLLLAACSGGGNATATSFNIFFVANSADLSADAQAALTQAADAVRRQRPALVTIAAGADTNASIRLAEPRYLAVRQALESRGVSAALISRASLPQIEANAGSTAIQRVEIILSPTR